MSADGKTLANYDKDEGGQPFQGPNDFTVDAKGGIYFTDPGPRPVVAGRPTYVYYLASGSRQPILLDGSIARPNGLTLTGTPFAIVWRTTQ